MTVPVQPRPDRSREMDAFLARIGWGGATRRMLAGDASFRRYERVTHQNTVAVLMDAPPPWEDVHPFIAVTGYLETMGLSAPNILAADAAEGFLLLEDLGDESFTRMLRDNLHRERELYIAATEVLSAIYHASREHATMLKAALKPYHMEVYLREVALFAEWFLPQVVGIQQACVLRTEFLDIWRGILQTTDLKQSCFVHRDFHADNLLWLENRDSYHAVGMIDYQDALWGDPAYDLASLLEDARRDVDLEVVADCFARYTTQTGEKAHAFARRYSVLAAQRNAKIIGIFCRLAIRDGKAHYIDYLPRVWGHFVHDLSHPALTPVREFVDRNVPIAWRKSFTADVSRGGIGA